MKLRNRNDIPKGFELKDNSTPSFSFVENYDGIEIKRKIKGWKKAATLMKLFQLNNENEAFTRAFFQVTSGNGNELNNILTIHSSALFALLLFYDVENNHVKIGNHTFDKVLFEAENKVIVNGIDCSKHRPSSIDVALYDSKESALLLLEVKLTEPLSGNKEAFNSNDKYAKWINENLSSKSMDAIGFKDGKLEAKRRDNSLNYNGGIKQLIAHFIGACNGPAEDFRSKDYIEYYNEARRCGQLYLATFLLSPDSDLLQDDGGKDSYKIDEYHNLVKSLGNALNKCTPKVVKIHEPFVLTPKDLQFNHSLAKGIIDFYHL